MTKETQNSSIQGNVYKAMHRVMTCHNRGSPTKFEDFKVQDVNNSLTSINPFFKKERKYIPVLYRQFSTHCEHLMPAGISTWR